MNDDILIDYEMEKVFISKRTVDSFTILNPRKIHKAQVKSILETLVKGENFDANLVVFAKGNRRLVIDGNHRVCAMREYFEMFPGKRIQVYLATYHKLKDEDVRKTFTKWNLGVSQSTDDFILGYHETIPMFKRLTSELPCAIYGTSKKMRLRDIVNAHMAKNQRPYGGGEGLTRMTFVRYMQRMNDGDVDEICRVFGILQKAFNAHKVKDWMKLAPFKNVIFRALYYLVANNLALGDDYIVARMRKVVANRAILEQYRRFYGRRASQDAYLSIKGLLNEGAEEEFK